MRARARRVRASPLLRRSYWRSRLLYGFTSQRTFDDVAEVACTRRRFRAVDHVAMTRRNVAAYTRRAPGAQLSCGANYENRLESRGQGREQRSSRAPGRGRGRDALTRLGASTSSMTAKVMTIIRGYIRVVGCRGSYSPVLVIGGRNGFVRFGNHSGTPLRHGRAVNG